MPAEVLERRLLCRIAAWLAVRLLPLVVGSFFRPARKNATKVISASTATTPTTVPATAAGPIESSELALPAAKSWSVGGCGTVGAAVASLTLEGLGSEMVGAEVVGSEVGIPMGIPVGEEVDGTFVGDAVGSDIVGELVVGIPVGEEVDGKVVGDAVRSDIVGELVGVGVGVDVVGELVGIAVGSDVVGEVVGEAVGSSVKASVGSM